MINEIKIDFGRVPEALMFKFFTYFSRIEAVWKSYEAFYDWKNGYLLIGKIADDLRTNKLDYRSIINHSVDLKYLCENPPREQVGHVKWVDYKLPPYLRTEQSIEAALDKMRNVRNNLFHGGKWSSLNNGDDRDMKLISGSVDLIELILSKQADWRARFNPDP
jgi:transposase